MITEIKPDLATLYGQAGNRPGYASDGVDFGSNNVTDIIQGFGFGYGNNIIGSGYHVNRFYSF